MKKYTIVSHFSKIFHIFLIRYWLTHPHCHRSTYLQERYLESEMDGEKQGVIWDTL